MKIIGLTGPSGAGKTTLCSYFEELGIPCIDTDDVYHKLVSTRTPCLAEIEGAFGSSVISEDGSLNRRALSALVFSQDGSHKNLETLNSITHKYVWEETNRLLTAYIAEGKEAAVIDAPALFSSKIFIGACDFVISVLADTEERIERITGRDGISREDAMRRLAYQPDDSFFEENSDYCITNSGSPESMHEQLLTVLEQEEISIG